MPDEMSEPEAPAEDPKQQFKALIMGVLATEQPIRAFVAEHMHRHIGHAAVAEMMLVNMDRSRILGQLDGLLTLIENDYDFLRTILHFLAEAQALEVRAAEIHARIMDNL